MTSENVSQYLEIQSHLERLSNFNSSDIINLSKRFDFDINTLTTYASTSTSVGISDSEEFVDTFEERPLEMRVVSKSSITCIVVYSILLVLGCTGNVKVFVSFLREYKKHRSRISLLILHLSVADLIVIFGLIPIEIAWKVTIQWYGGNLLCKACQFIRAFGLYLSSMVLICVSFDRFFAIVFPFKFLGTKKHVKIMLAMAWIASLIFSAPQAVFFNIESHPKFRSFHQCVTSSFLSKPEDTKLYSIFSVSAMYFAPLLVVIFTYTAILLKLIWKSRQCTSASRLTNSNENGSRDKQRKVHESVIHKETGRLETVFTKKRTVDPPSSLELPMEMPDNTDSPWLTSSSQLWIENSYSKRPTTPSMALTTPEDVKINGNTLIILRTSGNASSNITRAKNRTLKMTIVIVLLFVLCWTPYVVMTLWYMFDWETAQKVDRGVQDGLFLMAVANSCVNPWIYGSFTKHSRNIN